VFLRPAEWRNFSKPVVPKDAAEIATIDGVVEMGGTVRGKRRLILKDPETGARRGAPASR